MPEATDTAKCSDVSVGPKSTRTVASFDPNGYVALDDGREIVPVTFREAGVDPNRVSGVSLWASCAEGETAAPRQLRLELPVGLYKYAIFTTNTTDDGLEIEKKITERGQQVILQGMLTVSRACRGACRVNGTKSIC